MTQRSTSASPSATGDKLFSAAHFRQPDPTQALQWLRLYPFAALITAGASGLRATSLPFVVEEDDPTDIRLLGHIAARNPHAAELSSADEALIVANGPSAYVSPRWYASSANVPTWNYVGLQLRGRIELLPAEADRRHVLTRTVDEFERRAAAPWRLDDAPPDLVERLLGGIVAFRIGPCRLECVEKLGQNKPGADAEGTIAGLGTEGDELGHAIARLMRRIFSASGRGG
jgi:transcriptional regulator